MSRRVLITVLLGVMAMLAAPVAARAATISIASPAARATVAGAVGVEARVGVGDDVTEVDLTVDGTHTGSAFADPWGVLWDTRSVPDGPHTLRVTAVGSAGASTTSAPVVVNVGNGAGGGLAGTYFKRSDLTDPAFTRTDGTVDFAWKRARPADGMPYAEYSVRWAGTVEAPTTDQYTFHLNANDGVRLWLADRLLVDDWSHTGSATDHSAAVSLIAGKKYPLRIEYVVHRADSAVHLRWSAFHAGLTTIPQRLLQPSASLSARTKGLRAVFFGGRQFSSRRTLSTRVDPVLNFNWGTGSPDSDVPADNFAARWSGRFRAPHGGTYTFWVRADDGVRLWIGDKLVAGDWHTRPAVTKQGTIKLRAGKVYPIRIEYYEAWGDASLAVWWQQPTMKHKELLPTKYLYPDLPPPEAVAPTTGLIGTYYDNADFSGPSVERLDNTVDFRWDGGSPDPILGSDDFSARWTGDIVPPSSGSYELATQSDDGVRMFVNGQDVIDDWSIHPSGWNTARMDLQAGVHYAIEIQYYEHLGGASMRLAWTPPGDRRQTIPTQYLVPHEPAGPLLRQLPPAPPAVAQPGLWGTYWDNEDLSGKVVGRVDPNLNFDWRGGRPDPAIGSDTFSAEWTGSLAVPASGDYTFVSDADDGTRVWIDGALVIDRWTWHGTSVDTSKPVHLEAGVRHDVRIDQHDGNGDAHMKLRWRSASMVEQPVPAWAFMTPGATDATIVPPAPATAFGTPPATAQPGLWGQYYDNLDFTSPVAARVDAQIDADWGTGRAHPQVGSDTFSIRWSGTIEAPSAGDYRFYLRGDDGIRLWVCGALVVDAWHDQGATEYASTQTVHLEPGTLCSIRVDYYENGGGANVRLQWSSAGGVALPGGGSSPAVAKQDVPSTALRTPLPGVAPDPWW